MNCSAFISKANEWASQKIPFIFLVDFELQKPFICTLESAEKHGIYFSVDGLTNTNEDSQIAGAKIVFDSIPIDKEKYTRAFTEVMRHIHRGDSYLLNLTFATKIISENTLEQIFLTAHARYRLLFRNQFVLFSPECFIRTKGSKIFSYPMKGTIDADIHDAAQKIMGDKKETWEHNTIIDLIRNDLAMVAKNIVVTKYRYIDKIATNRKTLLQVSSEIQGSLEPNWPARIGTILLKMLPAGSISGAPKHKTVDIIRTAEDGDRGYFTGIFGVFDGQNINSAVNIRFIEKVGSQLQFRSGGGITALSSLNQEYDEMIDKVYVPII
jgi:para-aminobenzoate synthetase component 1